MNGIHPELLKQLKEYYKPGTYAVNFVIPIVKFNSS